MRTAFFAACLSFAATAAGAGTANVSFVDAQSFEDAGTTSWEEQANLQALTTHLQGLAQCMLPAGQHLKVEVLDVDLAGTVPPSVRGSSVRVLRRGADWPRIHLRYTLEADGKTLANGDERIADLNYTRGLSSIRESKPLYYEKRMLDAWFKTRFGEGTVAAR